MKSSMVFFLLLLLTIFLPCETVFGAYQREYLIEVHVNGSATWVIEQRFLLETEQDETMFRQYSNMTYFSRYFIKNVKTLLDMARLRTGRGNMTVENFEMSVSVFDSYKVVRYQFDWVEFAENNDPQIRIGDVFEVEGLFLLGDGTLNMVYPLGYMVESVSPKSNVESDRTLTWYAVTNFETGEPNVVLKEKTQGIIGILKENTTMIIVISLIALVGISSASLWFFKFRKKEKGPIIGMPTLPPVKPGIMDDEEKVATLLKSSGGCLYQSTIADQLEFSRSKTSKLLTSMENRGKVRRQKKGREKVVTLINELKDVRNKERKHY